jgi:hypothetical protein
VGGIGLYVYSINKQIDDIENICSLYPVNAPSRGISDIATKYSVKYMGSFEVEENTGIMRATFCAPLTMCDTSCSLEYKDNKIIKSTVHKY